MEWSLRSNPALYLEWYVRYLKSPQRARAWARAHKHVAELLQGICDRGVPLPRSAETLLQQENLIGNATFPRAPRRPSGVFALLVDEHGRLNGELVGLVDRLTVTVSERWDVPAEAAFRVEDLARMLTVVATHARFVRLPERRCFSVRHEVPLPAEGVSAHIAALLAMIDAANDGEAPLLRGACAFVAPKAGRWLDVDAALEPVGYGDLKLGAAIREIDDPTLIVAHPDDPLLASIQRYASDRGAKVWTVRTWRELVDRLDQHDLLECLDLAGDVSRDDARRLNAYLDGLLETHRDPIAAVRLADRISRARFAKDVPLADRWRHVRARLGANSRLGRFAAAEVDAQALLDEAERRALLCPAAVTREWLHRSRSTLASTMFTRHRFEEVIRLLGPSVSWLQENPGVVTVDTAAALVNTFARALVIARPHERRWEPLLRGMLDLQEMAGEPRGRTWGYLVWALLRTARLNDARAALDEWLAAEGELGSWSYADRTFHAYFTAEHARRTGAAHTLDVWLEPLAARGTLSLGQHPAELYFLSTARMSEDPSERRRRLELARSAYASGGGSDHLPLLRGILDLRCSAEPMDAGRWAETVDALEAFLRQPAMHAEAEFYRDAAAASRAGPSVDAADLWVERCALW